MHQGTLFRTQSTETFGREHRVYTLRYGDIQELLRKHQYHRNQLLSTDERASKSKLSVQQRKPHRANGQPAKQDKSF